MRRWLELNWLGRNIVFVAIYHPPKPIYDLPVFKDFLSSNVDVFLSNNDTRVVVLAGDFNQLQPDIPLLTGLFPVVASPTRGKALLDQMFVSFPKPLEVKVIKSAVKSDHMSIIISDHEKVKNAVKKKTCKF